MKYRLILDDQYTYYYDTLDDCCYKLAELLKSLNLIMYWDKGFFEKTSAFQKREKIKKYTIDISVPNLKFTIHYKGKEELDPDLVLYILQQNIKKASTK